MLTLFRNMLSHGLLKLHQGARSALLEGNCFAPQLFAEESIRIVAECMKVAP